MIWRKTTPWDWMVQLLNFIWPFGIKNDFVDLVEYCHKKGTLPDLMNRTLVRLLFKNRGERSDLNKFETYQSSQCWLWNYIESSNQTFVQIDAVCHKWRSNIWCAGQEHSRKLDGFKILTMWNLYNKDAAIISIDQEKVFDRIEWHYMYAMMNTMGAPSCLGQWIKMLYSNLMITINVNNFLSNFLKSETGLELSHVIKTV